MRMRTVKPDFFTNEDVASVSPTARLFFIGLWCAADKAGRIEDRPGRLRALLFPYEPEVNVSEIIEALNAKKLIERYEVDGVRYILIPNFKKHQRPHHKESESLLPDPKVRASPKKVRASTDLNQTSPEKVGARRVGSGILGDENGIRAKALSTEVDDAEKVFSFWKKTFKKTELTAFGSQRRKVVQARLDEGYTVESLCNAILGCSVTPHNMGQNDRGEKYIDLELICRTASQVDRFIQNHFEPPRPSRNGRPGPETGLMGEGEIRISSEGF